MTPAGSLEVPGAYSPAFYTKLTDLLGDPRVLAAMYRGHGDRRVMHMMACEQHSRTNAQGGMPWNALVLSVMAAEPVDRNEWGARFIFDKWSFGDLLVDGADLEWGCPSVKSLVENQCEGPRRYALTRQDCGPINGFDREQGDGWTLYRRQASASAIWQTELVWSRRMACRP